MLDKLIFDEIMKEFVNKLKNELMNKVMSYKESVIDITLLKKKNITLTQ